MGAFEWLLEAVKKARLFRRDKVSVEHKVRACLMYMSGLSTACMHACLNKPLILVDKGPWYWEAFQFLELSWMHITRGSRNRIERWFRALKERTRRFYNNFPTKKEDIECVKLFLETFTYWYNNLRTHQTLGRPPSQTLS